MLDPIVGQVRAVHRETRQYLGQSIGYIGKVGGQCGQATQLRAEHAGGHVELAIVYQVVPVGLDPGQLGIQGGSVASPAGSTSTPSTSASAS